MELPPPPPFDSFPSEVNGRHLYYDRAGNPLTMWEWAQKLESDDRIVERTEIPYGLEQRTVVVSTVWLGLDHNWFPGGPPLIFETMVFGGPADEEMHRYATEEEARLGHSGVVEMTYLRLMQAGVLDE